ncbi:MAG: DsbA family protein [Pyrinomonadaceae bacterium]
MAKGNQKTKAVEPRSNTPLLIIGGVLVLAALGGWWFYSSSKGTARPANTNRAANAANAAKTSQIPPNAPAGAQPPNSAGSPTASVTLEEFADFQCGSCAAAHPIMNEIKSSYGSRIRFVFRNYPLSIPAHDKAYDAAVAAEAAGMQGKFWDMQNLLFTNQQTWTASPSYKGTWKEYASKIGLDIAKWETDMAGIAARSRVDSDVARGKALGVSSTPTLYINGMALPFTEMKVQSIKSIIDGELQKAASASAPAPANPPANTENK